MIKHILIFGLVVCVTWDEVAYSIPWDDCPTCAVVRLPVRHDVGTHSKEFESIEKALEYFSRGGLGNKFENFRVEEKSCEGAQQ